MEVMERRCYGQRLTTLYGKGGTAVMWLIEPGDGLDRSRELLAEAERARFPRVYEATAPRSGETRRSRLRQRVGVALIRRGEELAGPSVGGSVRSS